MNKAVNKQVARVNEVFAREIFRNWCKDWGLAIDTMCAADLVNRIAAALSARS